MRKDFIFKLYLRFCAATVFLVAINYFPFFRIISGRYGRRGDGRQSNADCRTGWLCSSASHSPFFACRLIGILCYLHTDDLFSNLSYPRMNVLFSVTKLNVISAWTLYLVLDNNLLLILTYLLEILSTYVDFHDFKYVCYFKRSCKRQLPDKENR